MFGEKEIVGQTILRISKNRIIIPRFTGVEEGEEISPMFNFYKTKIALMRVQEFEERITKMAEIINEQYEKGEITAQQMRNYRRFIFGTLSFYPEKVSKSRGIHLDSRIISGLNLKDQVFAVGNETRLDIYPSVEAYEMTLKLEREND